ncbi:MAG: stage II sporulation protein M [Candidatus Aenigmarchaeota archaeon]|nr:stage II sporulation protein M [Candidatus Aenigmarchaeota archaeon]
MLESLLDPKHAIKNPLEVFLVASLFTTVSILFSYFLFPDHSSVLICAYITLLFSPFFQRLFATEEAKEEYAIKHRIRIANVFQRHSDLIEIFGAFFLGIIITSSLFAVFLPEPIKFVVFKKQIEELHRIASLATSGKFLSFDTFSASIASIQLEKAKLIFFNNLLVLLISFISSLLFGTGALLILTWNASIIATYVAAYVETIAAKGSELTIAYIIGMPSALLAITLHGIPEIIGYFFAGLAGGILSCGLVREKLWSNEMKFIFFDSLLLLSFGIFSIFFGAFIETSDILLSSIGFTSYLIFLLTLLKKGEFSHEMTWNKSSEDIIEKISEI